MARKRMFSLSVVDTDQFLDMPITSRLLYYELGMRADDDGFVDNWKKIIRFTGLSEDDMKILIAKKFIIPFDSGIIVIRHWRLNNYLQRDRITQTEHKEELAMLQLNDNVYELKSTENTELLENVYKMDTECIQTVYTDKIRLDKNRLDYIDDAEENSAVKFYLNNINSTPVQKEMEILTSYLKELPEDLLIYGMEKAVENKARNLAYCKGIWNSWISKGITTLAEAKEEKQGGKLIKLNWSGGGEVDEYGI